MGTDVLYEHTFSCQDLLQTEKGQDAPVDRVRIDKWLWAARFAKTRSAATELVLSGHVKVGGERIKPAREVAPGDTVEIRLGMVRRVVVVTGLADRRGPAKVAATLYEETPESREERERLAGERRLARPVGADLGARPTKLERRRLEALRKGQRRR
jgi:ribosome-associated heat shock protein Hsp15